MRLTDGRCGGGSGGGSSSSIASSGRQHGVVLGDQRRQQGLVHGGGVREAHGQGVRDGEGEAGGVRVATGVAGDADGRDGEAVAEPRGRVRYRHVGRGVGCRQQGQE